MQSQTATFSKAKIIEEPTNLTKTNQLKLSPNPALDAVQIDYYLEVAKNITVQVLDVNGRVLSTQFNNVEVSGWQSTSFETSHLSAGLYFVRVKSDLAVLSQRLVINRP